MRLFFLESFAERFAPRRGMKTAMSNAATYAIKLTLEGAGVAERGIRSLFGSISGGVHGLAAANSQLFYFGNNIAGLFRGAAGMGRKGAGIVESLIGPNEQFENAQMQFEQLLGSAEAADERIRELYAYANRTPFLNPDVLKAGRLLQMFGGDALGAGGNLEMVGDMASYAQTEMADVAFWVARAYSAIQGGRPWGEAAMRLMEMGLLTDTERAKMEQLAEAGAKSTEVWAAFRSAMDKARGGAARAGEGMTGLRSTLAGMWDEIKRLSGQGLFKVLEEDLRKLRDHIQAAFDDGRVTKWTGMASKAIKDLYSELKDKSLFGLSAEQLMSAAEQGKLIGMLSEAVEISAKNFGIFLRNAAIEHGPAIGEAIFASTPQLRKLLGFDKREAAAALAAGTWDAESLGKLGIGGQISMLRRLGEESPNRLFHPIIKNPVGNFLGGVAQAIFGGADANAAILARYGNDYLGKGQAKASPMVNVQQALAAGGYMPTPGAAPAASMTEANVAAKRMAETMKTIEETAKRIAQQNEETARWQKVQMDDIMQRVGSF